VSESERMKAFTLTPVVPARRSLEFELVERTPRDILRLVLIGVVEACAEGWEYATNFSLIPSHSIEGKLPYRR
jgi:hypothetical protein